MADSPEADRPLSGHRIWVAGYQAEPGGKTIPLSSFWGGPGLPVQPGEAPYPSEVEDANRTLIRVDDPQGNTHWYWVQDGVDDWEDALNRVIDLAQSGKYPELSE